MESRVLHIEFRKQGVYFNESEYIVFDQTNLTKEKVLFSAETPHPMILIMSSFNKVTGELNVEIVDYNKHDRILFQNQKPKADIKYLAFRNIIFDKLKPHLSFYSYSKLEALISDEKGKSFQDANAKTHLIKTKVNLKKVHFKNGKVSFKHNLKWYKESKFLEIHNVHIVKDYEYIKYYFIKHFGRKSIDVEIEAKSTKERIQLISVFSPQINSISSNTIKILKTKAIEEFTNFRNRKRFTPDSLLTIDDILKQNEDEAFGNIDISEKEILFLLIDKHEIRNAKELAYLANQIQDENTSLYLNLNPKIGFVFVFFGEELLHFIWELLDSNATYIWSKKKGNFESALKEIEKQISLIRSIGRAQYRHEFENSSTLYFNFLFHKTSKSEIDDPFPLWIKKIHELLI